MFKRNFLVGNTYLTQAGKRVTIIAESTKHGPHYTAVQGDDGEDVFENGVIVRAKSDGGWRYDRKGDVGRVTASAHDFSDPCNLVVGSLQEQPDKG